MDNFFNTMISVLQVNGPRISHNSLQGYVGGTALMRSSSSSDRILGEIESIQLIAGGIDLEFRWVKHQRGKQRKWRENRKIIKEHTLILERGWIKGSEGKITILGENGDLTLLPPDK